MGTGTRWPLDRTAHRILRFPSAPGPSSLCSSGSGTAESLGYREILGDGAGKLEGGAGRLPLWEPPRRTALLLEPTFRTGFPRSEFHRRQPRKRWMRWAQGASKRREKSRLVGAGSAGSPNRAWHRAAARPEVSVRICSDENGTSPPRRGDPELPRRLDRAGAAGDGAVVLLTAPNW